MCCLAEIPIQHLQYHSIRYGKCAVGFYREAIVKSEFNPVMYNIIDSSINKCVYEMLVLMENMKYGIAEYEAIEELGRNNGSKGDFNKRLNEANAALKKDFSLLENDLMRQVSNIKVFDKNEFETIYCEREWRSAREFEFTYDDIAMIVLPKEKDIYNSFIDANTLPKRIPVIPWEDLVEC